MGSRFRGQAKKLKNAMWWKNAKMMALIGLVIALVLYFLVALICGASFQNIDKVLERGEKIELLVDKTDRLQGEASRFRGQAKKLKNAMWWKNAKMMALTGLVIALVLYFLVALICGASFQKCAHHSNDNNNN